MTDLVSNLSTVIFFLFLACRNDKQINEQQKTSIAISTQKSK